MTGLASLRNASTSIGLVDSINVNSVSLITEFMVSDRVQISVFGSTPCETCESYITSVSCYVQTRFNCDTAIRRDYVKQKETKGRRRREKNDALKQKAT